MRFRRLVCVGTFILGALLLAQLGAGEEKPEKAGKNVTVKMKDNSFDPKEITIEVGDTITWMNTGDNPHTATSDKKDDPNAFDTKDVASGKSSKPVEFKKAGTVPYH